MKTLLHFLFHCLRLQKMVMPYSCSLSFPYLKVCLFIICITTIQNQVHGQEIVTVDCKNEGNCPTGYVCHRALEKCIATNYNSKPCEFNRELFELAQQRNGHVTLGVGFGASFFHAISTEWGTAYGANGEFGCYTTNCSGMTANVGGTSTTIWSFYDEGISWDEISGSSKVWGAEISPDIPFTDIGIGFLSGQIMDISGLKTLGYFYAFNASFGASANPVPFEPSYYSCETELKEFDITMFTKEFGLSHLRAATFWPLDYDSYGSQKIKNSWVKVEEEWSNHYFFVGADRLDQESYVIALDKKEMAQKVPENMIYLDDWGYGFDPTDFMHNTDYFRTDAMFSDDKNIYFFSENQVIKYEIDAVANSRYYPTHNRKDDIQYLKDFYRGWEGFTHIDAAVAWEADRALLFSGSSVITIDRTKNFVERPSQLITDAFKGVPQDFIPFDAAFSDRDRKIAYFFKGYQYIEWDIRNHKFVKLANVEDHDWKGVLLPPHPNTSKQYSVRVKSIASKSYPLCSYFWILNAVVGDAQESIMLRSDWVGDNTICNPQGQNCPKRKDFSGKYQKVINLSDNEKEISFTGKIRVMWLPDNTDKTRTPEFEINLASDQISIDKLEEGKAINEIIEVKFEEIRRLGDTWSDKISVEVEIKKINK